MHFLRKIWKDPVFSTVIGGVIATIFLAHQTVFFSWFWRKTLDFYGSVCSWMIEPSGIPKWALLILCALLAFSLLFICVVFYVNREQSSPETSWKDYMKDNFFNLRWRWQYVNSTVSHMNCFCSRCDLQIVPKNGEDLKQGRFIDISEFACDSCNVVLYRADKSAYDVREEAIRHVQKNLRNGDWKRVVSPDSQ